MAKVAFRRKFNGKVYEHYHDYPTKRDAEKAIRALRELPYGTPVRLVKTAKGYSIFMRPQRGSRR